MKKVNKKNFAFAGLSIIVIVMLVILIRMNVVGQENNNLSKENMQNDLQAVSQYLTELDNNVLQNQNKVQEIIQNNSTEFLSIQEQLSVLKETLNKNKQELSSYIKNYQNDNKQINSEIQIIQDQINLSHQRIDELQFELTDILNNMSDNFEDRLTNINESIKLTKESLENTKTTILNVLDEIKIINDSNYEGLKQILTTMHQEISEQMQIDMENISKKFDTLTLEINDKLTKVRSEIQQTQSDISNILAIMGDNSEKNHKELITQFENVTASIEAINADLISIYEDIRNLIQHLEQQGNENYSNTISVLSDMELSIQNDLKDKLVQINQSFQSLNNDMTTQFNTLLLDVNQNFVSTNKNVKDSLAEIKESLLQQEQNLTMLFEAKSNEVSQKLDLLFQSVSNGKSGLASALLTKGVNIEQDASFEEIKQAILNIKQQLLVGIEKLPGEISYDYHYHIDVDGNQPHTDTLLNNGGCYSVPVYHVHISSCYSTRACGGEAEQRTYMVQGCNCGPQLGGGTRCGTHGCSFDPPSAMYPSGCARCNCPKATEWFCKSCGAKSGGSVCYEPKTVLVCPKKASTIDKYRVGCKLNDGQIIAAHIVYTKTSTLQETNTLELPVEYVPQIMEDEVYVFVEDESLSASNDNNASLSPPPEGNDNTTEILPPVLEEDTVLEDIEKNPDKLPNNEDSEIEEVEPEDTTFIQNDKGQDTDINSSVS